ncbi:uncharacterized protein [Parasteatoda tepidariorum]|uniref:uncharacterized protein n=1 Tax=Parasteatoda tepidariorum TaxID=114398 RepID=UPI00077F8BF0|nr:uncharacterized protein LOC107454090 isoform X1 [Parasteatoda tepidariorum]
MSSIHFPYALLVILFASCSSARCQDFIRRRFCWNQDFRLDCSWNSVLAIHEAYFTNNETEVNRTSCFNNRDGRLPCTEDLRIPLNRRCSGTSHCSFNLTEDHPDRECFCKGVIILVYSCVKESDINKFCNSKITSTSGYISSPGYPRYYTKVSNCTWTIESSIMQEMKLTILDLNMRTGIQARGREICPDNLMVLENGHKIRYTCGHLKKETMIPLTTRGGLVKVRFQSNEFLPSRGFLLYYKFNGCRQLPPPRLGYLVYSNNRSALYMCCKGHVFNDSLSNSLLLQCIDGTYWNGTVSSCMSMEEAIRLRSNDTNFATTPNVDIVEVYLRKHNYVEEILIPMACVVGLVFGNVAIILLIQKIRKKRKTSASNHNGRSTSEMKKSTSKPQTLQVPVNIPIDSTIPPITNLPGSPRAVSIVPASRPIPTIKQAPRVLMTDL